MSDCTPGSVSTMWHHWWVWLQVHHFWPHPFRFIYVITTDLSFILFPKSHLYWSAHQFQGIMTSSVESPRCRLRTSSTPKSAGFLRPPPVFPVSSGTCASRPIWTLPRCRSSSMPALRCSRWAWRGGCGAAGGGWDRPRDTWRTECGSAWLRPATPTAGRG